MKEIGGYFGLEQFQGQEYYPDLIALNSARNALLYILRARNVQKLYIPYYLCDSISMICDRYGYKYEYYHITPDFMPTMELNPKAGEWVYVVNYFGQISNGVAIKLKERYKNIIFDNVQAFFQKPVSGIDTVYSCRKFFGVPDGGYVSTAAEYPEQIENDESSERMKHVLGRYEHTASEYYNDFRSVEETIDQMPLARMSLITQNILRGTDYEFVRKRRNSNYKVLEQALYESNGLKFFQPNGPYVYPYYVCDGVEVRKKMAEKKIFIATLWPNVLNMDAPMECDYVRNILPLPCDQRYGEEDMQRIISELMNMRGNDNV